MADNYGLQLIGILFATVTLGVMSASVLVVKGHADGKYAMESYAVSMPSGADNNPEYK